MIYYGLITFLVSISQINAKKLENNKFFNFFVIVLIFILILLVVLLMPMRIDMIRYLEIYKINSYLSLPEALAQVRWESGFVTFQWVLSKISTSKTFFIITTLTVMWLLIMYALKQIFYFKSLPLILFGYLSFFSFYNFFSNVIRQGFAVSFLLLVIVFLSYNKYKKATLFFVVSLLFHSTAFIAIFLFVVKKFKLTLKSLFIFFTISAVLMVTGINQNLMSGLALYIGGNFEDSLITYSSDSTISIYGSVNRIDFLIFTSFWVFWGLWFRDKFLENDYIYEWLLKSYLTFSSIYFLFGFIGFSDRLAAYAWFLIPILLFYPCITMRSRYQYFWVLLCIFISICLFVYFGTFSLYAPLKILY